MANDNGVLSGLTDLEATETKAPEDVKKTPSVDAAKKSEAPKKTGKGINHKSISGTGVDLYLRTAYLVHGKDDNLYVGIVPVKRRDLAGEKNFGGAYVVNQRVNGKNYHSQLLRPKYFNELLKAAGKKEVPKEYLTTKNADAFAKQKRPLLRPSDNIAFRANVFSDSRVHGSHLINQTSIQAPSKPFDYANEHELDKQAAAAKKAAKAATKAASTAKEADGPEA
jgi:hypothetical protein